MLIGKPLVQSFAIPITVLLWSIFLLAKFLCLQNSWSWLKMDEATWRPPIVIFDVFAILNSVKCLNTLDISLIFSFNQLTKCHASSSA